MMKSRRFRSWQSYCGRRIVHRQHVVDRRQFKPVIFINEEANVSILNLQGKLVFTKKLISNSQNLDLAFLERGIYFLKIETNSFSEMKKIIKQ